MQRKYLAAFVVATVFWPVGCSEDYVPSPRPKTIPEPEKSAEPEPSPAAETPVPAAETPAPAAETPPVQPSAPRGPAPLPKSSPTSPPRSGPAPLPKSSPIAQPKVETAPANPSPSKPPPTTTADQQSIELSTGVALAQPGPEGTMMMFSVEYEFVLGEPNPKAGYVWVIEQAKGAPAKLAFPLKKKGTLNTAIFHWRPENKPFRSHIEDRDGKRLSASIEML